jgi:Ni/Co efflux regulator RcnB
MKRFIGITLAGILLVAANASGQNNPNYQDRRDQPQGHPVDMKQARPAPQLPAAHNQRQRQNNNQQFSRGQRAPSQYRQPKYYVNDWQAQRLNRPPSGYRWVHNDNNQYLLIAIATGIISQVFVSENNQNYRIWHTGENLPIQYRRNNSYVNDWGNHGLSRPSSDRRWVHVNHQYLLITKNGGRIRAAVSSN